MGLLSFPAPRRPVPEHPGAAALTAAARCAAVEAIFSVLCDCAAKNPDPGQSADEEDGDFFYDEDEVRPPLNLSQAPEQP